MLYKMANVSSYKMFFCDWSSFHKGRGVRINLNLPSLIYPSPTPHSSPTLTHTQLKLHPVLYFASASIHFSFYQKLHMSFHLILVYDESTFKSGELSIKRWFFGEEAPFHSKGRGRSNMVSDYLVQHPSTLFFSLSQSEYQKALVKYPQLDSELLVNRIIFLHHVQKIHFFKFLQLIRTSDTLNTVSHSQYTWVRTHTLIIWPCSSSSRDCFNC